MVRDSPTLGTQRWTQEARAPQEPLCRARPGSSQETCKIVTLASGWGAAEADGEAGGVSTWEEARTGETRRDGGAVRSRESRRLDDGPGGGGKPGPGSGRREQGAGRHTGCGGQGSLEAARAQVQLSSRTPPPSGCTYDAQITPLHLHIPESGHLIITWALTLVQPCVSHWEQG